jgi:hypothetical protein
VILPLLILLLSITILVLFAFAIFGRNIHHHEDKYHDKVEDQHSNGTSKAIDIPSADAFAEEHTMMVVIIDAHITILTVLHIFSHIDVAFHAVENFVSASL